MEPTASRYSLQQFYLAPPEVVFDAWVQPALMQKWLFVGPTSEVVNIEIDLTTGGKFSMLERETTTNETIDHFGSYLEISRPHTLEFTLSAPKHFKGETRVLIEITGRDGGSELTFSQTGVPKELTEPSWIKMLAQLKLTLENQ